MMIELLSLAADRGGRALAAALLCASATGCASLKTMTEDFERKWDDPQSILAEMDETAETNRAASSSAGQMAAFNANDCARKAGLAEIKADDLSLNERRLAAGECLLGERKDKEAADLFALAASASNDAKAHQGHGVALVRLGRYDEAANALQAAIAIDPALWRAWNAFGVAADYLGRTEEALAAFEKAGALNAADGAALNNLGVALLKADRREEAIIAFRRALEIDGARDAAEANLRLAYALGGDYASAVKALPDAKRAVALNNAGVAAASRGDKDEARRMFNRALDESPHFYAKAYNNLSLLTE